VSRAERGSIPATPSLPRALRAAAEDLYFHGVRLVVVNLAWGIAGLAAAFALLRTPLGLVVVLGMVPLSIGLMGMATAVVRERSLVMSDAVRVLRGRAWRVLGLGAAQLGLVVVAAVDLLLGLRLGGMVGLILVVAAAYTLLAIWVLTFVVWPLVADPARRDEPIRSSLRLGVVLVLTHPVRIGLLALVLAVLAVISTVLVAAIMTFMAAYLALVAAHTVLPGADRLEGRATPLVDDDV
jgi:uncharacterized membrane protein YesL